MKQRTASVRAAVLRVMLVCFLGWPLVAAPTDVQAQRSPAAPTNRDREARALAEQGFTAFDAGRYDDAIAAFEAARALAPTPGLLYNLAQAYRLKGSAFCSQAQSLYEQYLAEDPTTERRDKVEAQMARMKAC